MNESISYYHNRMVASPNTLVSLDSLEEMNMSDDMNPNASPIRKVEMEPDVAAKRIKVEESPLGLTTSTDSAFAYRDPQGYESSLSDRESPVHIVEEMDDIVILPREALGDVATIDAPDDMDTVVAQQMLALSMEDREKVYSDIHGVSDNVVETPELIQSSLEAMDVALRNLSDLDAYNMAKQMDEGYVRDVKFRLSFLRADLFDSYRAALRYARHYQAKLDLFGKDKLARDIVQDDLDEETMALLQAGYLQVLPIRDRAGRSVRVAFPYPPEVSLHARLCLTFYTSVVSNEDEETQRKGRVAVAYLGGQNSKVPASNGWQVAKLLEALPVRVEAVHLCHDSRTIWTPVFTVFKFVASMFTRLRIREHFGDQRECLFRLQTFGIPVSECFPLSPEGKILTKQHVEHWDKRRKLERARNQTTATTSDSEAATANGPSENDALTGTVNVPGRNDVLLGRGKGFYQHLGNIRFRHLVESRASVYDAAKTSPQKRKIVDEVISIVQQSSGRFLKDGGMGWVQVETQVARQKVGHVFRSLRVGHSQKTPKNV